MKIEVNEIGGGLTRLNIVANPWEGTVPTAVADDIMRDVIRRKQNGDCGCGCHPAPQPRPWLNGMPRPVAQPMPAPNREPDGIDVHVDRPRRENYGGHPVLAEDAFRNDLRKYRSLEAIAKQCNWPAREPMKGAPNYRNLASQKPQTQFVGVSAPQPRTPLCGCGSEKMALREAIGALAAIVERM